MIKKKRKKDNLLGFIKVLPKMPKYTQWTALGCFSHGGVDFIVLIRKNNRTGMLFFKTKRVNKTFFSMSSECVLPAGMINTQEVWDELTRPVAITTENRIDPAILDMKQP
jgi:hypothetical protein